MTPRFRKKIDQPVFLRLDEVAFGILFAIGSKCSSTLNLSPIISIVISIPGSCVSIFLHCLSQNPDFMKIVLRSLMLMRFDLTEGWISDPRAFADDLAVISASPMIEVCIPQGSADALLQ
jgi:hypothetical protein